MTKQKQIKHSLLKVLIASAILEAFSFSCLAESTITYTTTSIKQKANEILNAASVRAMHVAAQIQSGSSSPSLGEFSSENSVGRATFKTTVTKTDSQFALTVNDIDSDVCEQITNLVGDSSNVNVSDDCATFTYNNDLSAPVTPAATTSYDGPTDTDGSTCNGTKLGTECQICSKGEWIDSDAKCPNAGSTCVDGSCTTPSTSCINETCETDINECSITANYCTKDSECSIRSSYDSTSGMCIRAGTNENVCAKNSDCASNEFCNYSGIVSAEYGPNGKSGKCENAGSSTYQILTSSIQTGSNWILSNSSLDWYSAKNFCLANHMQMVSLSDIGCSISSGCKNGNFPNFLKTNYYFWWVKDLEDDANSAKAYYVKTSSEGGDLDGCVDHRHLDFRALCK